MCNDYDLYILYVRKQGWPRLCASKTGANKIARTRHVAVTALRGAKLDCPQSWLRILLVARNK